MPQHPILRVYEFTKDWPSTGDLSWTAKDVQAWTDSPIYYNKDYWEWSKDPSGKGRPTAATTKPYLTGPENKEVVTIRYENYLQPASSCSPPIINSGSLCNIKSGSDITICWKDQPNTTPPAKYIVKDYTNLTTLLTTPNSTIQSYVNKGVGDSPKGYVYYVYSQCNDGSFSTALEIPVPDNYYDH